jgi:hypothetical protein
MVEEFNTTFVLDVAGGPKGKVKVEVCSEILLAPQNVWPETRLSSALGPISQLKAGQDIRWPGTKGRAKDHVRRVVSRISPNHLDRF